MVNTLFRSEDIKAVEGKIDEIMEIADKIHSILQESKA